MFLLSTSPDSSVAVFFNRKEDLITMFRAPLNGFGQLRYEQFNHLLQTTAPQDGQDFVIWKGDSKGSFSLTHGGMISQPARKLWSIPSPTKVKVFNQLLIQNRVFVVENLRKHHVQTPFSYSLCMNQLII